MNPFGPAYPQFPWLSVEDPPDGSPQGPLAWAQAPYGAWQAEAPSPTRSPLFGQIGPPSGWAAQQSLSPTTWPGQVTFGTGENDSTGAIGASLNANPSAASVGSTDNFATGQARSGSQSADAGRSDLTFSPAAPDQGPHTRLYAYGYGSTSNEQNGLDDGVYRPASSERATFLPVAASEEDDVAENGENPSPQQMYRSYQFNQAARELRQIEPDNPLGYRQFWGAPRDQDVDEIQTELREAQGRAWIRQNRPDLANVKLPDVRPTWPDSESHANEAFGSRFDPQRSFSVQGPARYGLRGSVRPDFYRDGDPPESIEVKNYNLQTAQGRSNLVVKVRQQAIERATHLPLGTRQHLFIDAYGPKRCRTLI